MKNRLGFYNDKFDYYVSNTRKYENIARNLKEGRENIIVDKKNMQDILQGYPDIKNKIDSINFNLKNFNQHFIRFNNDGFFNIKKSLLLEKNLKQKHLTKFENFEKFKSEKTFPVKFLKHILFDDMKIKTNNNDLYFMQKGLEPRLIDESFFNENEEFWIENLKRLFDFIKCNILYEKIPIYKKEYTELIFHIKKYLFNFYFLRYENLDFYEIVYYTYCRNILFSTLNYYKRNSSQIVNSNVLNTNNDKNKLDYLIYFGHHRTQNSILKLLIPIKNFVKLYESTKENNEKFNIIANHFCGFVKFQLFYANDFKRKEIIDVNENCKDLKCYGLKLFYESNDITSLIDPKILGKVSVQDNTEIIKENLLEKLENNDYFIDMPLFEKLISDWENQYQNINFDSFASVNLDSKN